MVRRTPEPPRGLDGLPLAEPREQQVARAITLVATVWFTLAAAWEMFGPIPAGHYASMGSMGIIADNMLRWHIAGPVWEYTSSAPGPEMYYCHHPWGIFWTTTLLMKMLGRHDFVCRLPAVLLSAATPPLLYALGRAMFRPAAGAAAAAAFVVLPITLAFAGFNALEVPTMAWSLLGLWGFVRMTQTGRRRHLAFAIAGILLAEHADWPGFMLAGMLLGFGVVRAILARDVFGPLRHERRYAAFWILTATGSALTLLLYLALFQRSGKLDDWLGSYGQRAAGNAMPLRAVLASRRYWIELSFSPIAIVLGKVAAVVSLLRLVVLRREHEVIPLALLGTAVVQYGVFKQGADVHIFWPHYFGAAFALGMAVLTATLTPLLGRLKRLAPQAPVYALGVALLPLTAIARDGIPALRYAHETGGRFNEKGLLIDSDGDKNALLRDLDARLPKHAVIDMHESMKTTWAQVWALGGRIVHVNRPAPSRSRAGGGVFLLDTRHTPYDVQERLAADFHITAVGPLWVVNETDPAAPIDALAFVEHEPSWWAWYGLSGTEPVRTIVPDPYVTWELRVHFGQAAQAPTASPVTLEQQRIAHNIAVQQGDRERATALRAALERTLTPVHAAFEDGTELVGTTYHEGACDRLTLWIQAGGPTRGDVQLAVRSKVVARAAWSTTMADPIERDVGLPLAIAPQRWKKGFLYADPVTIRKRPGTEVYRASFWVRGTGIAPKRVGGGGPVDVLTLR